MAEYAKGRVKASVNCILTELNLMDYHRLTTGNIVNAVGFIWINLGPFEICRHSEVQRGRISMISINSLSFPAKV